MNLEITDLNRRLSSNVPDVITDLVEIASYVYCADQAVSRGGDDVLNFGRHWRRNFIFYVPVRSPSVWSSPSILQTLSNTLSTLTEDTFEFHFVKQRPAVPMQEYLGLGHVESEAQEIDEVLLFSGGVDSLGGAVEAAVRGKRRAALVSHRSNPKIFARQKQLVQELGRRCTQNAPLHIPVWVHRQGSDAREYTQRSRTFLYASLALAVANVFRLDRIQFYENGVVSLNLPISEQVIGTRATRTTHPKVLSGFAELFSQLLQRRCAVENPFLWFTKTEVINLIGDAGCGHLIENSVSCMHTHEQTKEQPHCGRCSQCISRRLAALASRFSRSDPTSLYRLDLLTGERLEAIDRTLVESFIRTATEIGSMTDGQIMHRYGEISRVLRHVPQLSADQVAERIVSLHRRHSAEVTAVMDEAISAHASAIREGHLPRTCAVILSVSERYRGDGLDKRERTPSAHILDDFGWYEPSRIAENNGVDKDALRQRLTRYRKHNMDGWKVNDDRRPRESRYLYQLRAIKPIVEALQASSERPAK